MSSLITFGGGPADITTDSTGNAVGGITLKVYSQLTGGQRITELYDLGGSPLPGVVTSSDSTADNDLGRVSFRASDSYYTLFLDRGYGQRWQVSAATLGEDVAKAIVKADDALGQASEAVETARTVNGALANIEANVRLFGAIGDGTHDDSAAFRAAINSRPGGVRVVIPKGTWLLKDSIQLQEGTWLDAQPGAVIKRGHNGYLLSIGISADRDDATSFPGYSGPGNIRITGGVWDGNGVTFPQKSSTIHLAHTQNIRIEQAEFRDVAASHHIELNAAKNVRITQCRFVGYVDADESTLNEAIQLDLAAEGGMWMKPYDGTPCRHVVVEQCYFGPSGTPGSIDLARGVGSHATRAGIWHEDIVIRDNVFESCRSFAVRCLSYKHATVEGNRIKNCQAGINWRTSILTSPPNDHTATIDGVQTGESQEAPFGRIIGNVITGGITGSARPIEVRGETTGVARSIEVSGNSISDTQTGNEAILFYRSEDASAFGNTIRDTNGEGIAFLYSSRCSAVANHIIRTAKTVGIRIGTGSSMASVTGNDIDTPSISGIGVYEAVDVAITSNNVRTIRGDGAGIIASTNAENVTVSANTISDITSTRPAVWITGTTKKSRGSNNIVPGSTVANGAASTTADEAGNVS